MMTTAPDSTRRPAGAAGAGPLARVMILAGGAATGLSLIVVVIALVVGGAAAGAGALVGMILAIGVFLTGTAVIHVVARLMPTAALLVALMTFTLQVLVMALVFWRLNQSGLLTDGTLEPAWLAATLIVATVAWSAGQIRAVTHARIPVYDLPDDPTSDPAQGGDR